MKARYKKGGNVFYPYLNSYGTIRNIINADDPDDLRLQGPRYEVYFEKYGTYSITEKSLMRRKEVKNEASKNQPISSTAA